ASYASASQDSAEMVGTALGAARGVILRLEDRVRLICESEAGKLCALREQARRQPDGREQRAALEAQRACRGRALRRQNRGLAVWTQHRLERRYKFGAAGPRFAGQPRDPGAAAGQPQLVSTLPRLGPRVRRTA